jgi:hypothetical protein
MSATAISLAICVAGVVPVDGVELDPELEAVTSRGAPVAAPLRSITVTANDAVGAVMVTVKPPVGMTLAAFGAYHISASAVVLRTDVALSHELPPLSVMLLRVASPLVLRTATTMTRRSPDVVATVGATVNRPVVVDPLPPKLCTTANGVGVDVARAENVAVPRGHCSVNAPINPMNPTHTNWRPFNSLLRRAAELEKDRLRHMAVSLPRCPRRGLTRPSYGHGGCASPLAAAC